MAENSNLTANLQNKPSIFELVAAESLDNTCYPAITKLFEFLVNFGPSYLKKCQDEIILFLNGSLQGSYLWRKSGTLGESFYGLEKFCKNGQILADYKKVAFLISTVILPYAKKKADDNSVLQLHYQKILHYLSLLKSFYNLWKTAQMFLYLIKYRIKSHSPIMELLGVGLRYCSPISTEDKISVFIFRCLEIMTFFLQFIQWWQTNNSTVSFGNLPIPEPPKSRISEEEYNLCPICLQHLTHATVAAISGYAFCYGCIVEYISKHKKCPVTNYPLDYDDLIKIYET